MNEIIHTISWENICYNDNEEEYGKDIERLLQKYSKLLDLRNIEIRETGPLLNDLPNKCLEILRTRFEFYIKHIEDNVELHGITCAFVKLLCVLGRNSSNLAAFSSNNLESLFRNCIDIVFRKQVIEESDKWLTLLEYLLFFMEITYDPRFCWRQQKKMYYSDESELEEITPPSIATTVTNETVIWIHTHLSQNFNDVDIRNRLLHLLCCIICGSKENAQFFITPAIIDSIKLSSDLTSPAETLMSYSCLIGCLAQVTVSERQEYLTDILKKFFDYIENKPEIRVQDLRIIKHLVNISSELTKHVVEDRIFSIIRTCLSLTAPARPDADKCRLCFRILAKITCGPVSAKSTFLENNGYDKVFQYLSSCQLQSAFLLDLTFSWAVYNDFDPSKLISKNYTIYDGYVVGLLINWGSMLAMKYRQEDEDNNNNCKTNESQISTSSCCDDNEAVVNWKAIFKLIVELCSYRDRSSITECCSANVVSVVCENIKFACRKGDEALPEIMDYTDNIQCDNIARMQWIFEDLLNGLFHLLRVFLAYSVSREDVISLLHLFKDRHSQKRGKRIIKLLNETVQEAKLYNVYRWFELTAPGDCISILPLKRLSSQIRRSLSSLTDRMSSPYKTHEEPVMKISASGLTFNCWINVKSMNIESKVNLDYERWCLFRILTDKYNGFEVFISMEGRLTLATCCQGEYHYVNVHSKPSVLVHNLPSSMFEQPFLTSGKWQMLTIVFQNAKNLFSRSSVAVYLDGCLAHSSDLKYPLANEEITLFHVGGCPPNFQLKRVSMIETKSRRKIGFLNSTTAKRVSLGDETSLWGRLSTLRCRLVSALCVNDSLTDAQILMIFDKGPMIWESVLSDDYIANQVLISIHALAFDYKDNCCFNLNPAIQASKNKKYLSGKLYGQCLGRQRFENVINEIGGITNLIMVIEQLEFIDMDEFKRRVSVDMAVSKQNSEEEGFRFPEVHNTVPGDSGGSGDISKMSSPDLDVASDDRFIHLGMDKTTDKRLTDSILASVFILIRKLCYFGDNKNQLERTKSIPVIGAMMQKAEVFLLEMNVIVAAHALADQCGGLISHQVYQFILLDWRIWSRCSSEVRIQHANFVLNLLKHELNTFRNDFGILHFLDTIRFYHYPDPESSMSEFEINKQLRETIYSMIYYLIHKHASVADYQKVVKFIHDCRNDTLIVETLNMLTRIYQNSEKDDHDIILMYENCLMETLFVLLIRPLADYTKEEVIKFLHLMISADRIPEKFKGHLLLNGISFSGIFICKEFYETVLSPESIQYLLHILKKAASKDLFGVVQFLSLLTLCPLNQRIEAVRMMKSFYDLTEVVSAISHQPGWQDIMVHLLVLRKREEHDEMEAKSVKVKSNDEQEMMRDSPASFGKGFPRSSIWMMEDTNSDQILRKFDEITEMDEDDCSILDQVIAKEIEENPDVKSLETIHFSQRAKESSDNDNQWAGNTINLAQKQQTEQLQREQEQEQQQQQQPQQLLQNAVKITCCDFVSEELIDKRNKMSIIYDMDGREIEHQADIMEEVLCELVLECIVRSVWSQVTSAVDAGTRDVSLWMSVHQVIESLVNVNERYILLKPIFYFKQQILLKLLVKMINFTMNTDVPLKQKLHHATELIQLVVDTTSQYFTGEITEKYDLQIMEYMMTLLQDYLMVWQDGDLISSSGLTTAYADDRNKLSNLAGLGYYYLLILLKDSDIGIVAGASARLHQIITSVPKNITYEEVSFIILHLDQVLQNTDTASDYYYFIIPVLKTILESHYDLLQIQIYLPNSTIKTPEFIDDFKIYCRHEEWRHFVKNRLYSGCEIYQSTFLDTMTTVQSLCRAQANEQNSKDRKKRRSMSLEYKRKFDAAISILAAKWIKEEQRRKESAIRELQLQHEAALKQWGILKDVLLAVNWVWREDMKKRASLTKKVYWKLSPRENHLRMRPRFEPNTDYSSHDTASYERDHPSGQRDNYNSKANNEEDTNEPDPILRLSALEARIDYRGDDMLGEEDWVTIQSLNNNIETSPATASNLPFLTSKKVIIEDRCKLVVVNEVVEGRFELSNTHFMFYGNGNTVDVTGNTCHLIHPISQIREVHLRRYNLRRSAIEIFLTDQTNYFFNFNAKIRNKIYSKILSLRPPNLIYSKQRSPADVLKSSNLTQKWVNREISNFEYLMQLNTIAGRTYNDLSQYPIFPWIIADYTSPKLNLENPKTFRDLSKPIGVVNPKNEREVQEKFENFEDPNGIIKKFHYGTHYSSAAGVMHYLVRVEPYTTMHIQLQSGKFDIADRQFHSIPVTWNFIMETPNDNKELIPEFFYYPNFLRNENDFDFGRLQHDHRPIDDVELPAWSSSPEDFIYQHRHALECDYVSQNLHHWIDLIFGYKQKGQEAVKALNVFYYVSYEGYVDLDQIKDPYERESLESMINNFGQTPCQLLKTPHPRRITESDVISQMIKADKCLPVLPHLKNLRHVSRFISNEIESICYLAIPSVWPKNLINRSVPIITVHTTNIVARHFWYPSLKGSQSHNFQIDVDTVFDNGQQRKKQHIGPRSCEVGCSTQLYALSPDGRYLVCGGDVHNRLIIITLASKKVEVLRLDSPHHRPISCVSMDTDSALSMSGNISNSTGVNSGVGNAANSGGGVGGIAGSSAVGSSSGGGGLGSMDSSATGNGISSNSSIGITSSGVSFVGAAGDSSNNTSSGTTSLIGGSSGSVRVYGVTGGLDGLVVVWDWTCPNNGSAGSTVHRVLHGVAGRVSCVLLSVYLDLAAAGGSRDSIVTVWSVSKAALLYRVTLGKGMSTSPPNVLGGVCRLLLAMDRLLVLWNCGSTASQFLSSYSLQGQHLASHELLVSSSGVTLSTCCSSNICSAGSCHCYCCMVVAPRYPGSLDYVVLLGSPRGELHVIDCQHLVPLDTLLFNQPILDVQFGSSYCQQLLVALLDGSIVLSTVNLSALSSD